MKKSGDDDVIYLILVVKNEVGLSGYSFYIYMYNNKMSEYVDNQVVQSNTHYQYDLKMRQCTCNGVASDVNHHTHTHTYNVHTHTHTHIHTHSYTNTHTHANTGTRTHTRLKRMYQLALINAT